MLVTDEERYYIFELKEIFAEEQRLEPDGVVYCSPPKYFDFQEVPDPFFRPVRRLTVAEKAEHLRWRKMFPVK